MRNNGYFDEPEDLQSDDTKDEDDFDKDTVELERKGNTYPLFNEEVTNKAKGIQ